MEIQARRPSPDWQTVRAHVSVWHQALRVQGTRVLDEDAGQATREADFALFAIALRNLLRVAELMRKMEVDVERATKAESVFDAAVPNAVDVRDFIEHFDDYARGEGNLQRKAKDAAVQPVVWSELKGDGYTFSVSLMAGSRPSGSTSALRWTLP